MNKKVIAVVGGEVIDNIQEQTGLIPALTLADGDAVNAGLKGVTGHLAIKDLTADSSALAVCHVDEGLQVIDNLAGAGTISDSKDTASSVNVYVESGSIFVQNTTGADVEVSIEIV